MISEEFYSFPQAIVSNDDTMRLGTTDAGGNFNVTLQADTKIIIISGISMEQKLIELPIDCDHLEVILLNTSTYHFMSPRKVDRLRRRDFDKLTELHHTAFHKGIFKRNKPCYEDKFVPIRQELKEIRRRLNKGARHL